MTTLMLLSDLHFEHHADSGRSFVDSLDPSGVDVLVLAGDIAGPKSIENALTMFSTRFPKAIILYVEGNHEYYDSNRQKVHESINSAVFGCLHDSTNNLHWLKNDVYRYFPGNILELGGDSPTISKNNRRILGTTLWFPFVPSDYAKTWSDFAYIEDFFHWVYLENRKAVEFLERELCEGDIVITHYLPSPACIAPKWQGDKTNCFFVTDLTRLIKDRKPALWMHGHTHESIDVKIGSTRVVCNPFGYVNIDENPNFSSRFLVTL